MATATTRYSYRCLPVLFLLAACSSSVDSQDPDVGEAIVLDADFMGSDTDDAQQGDGGAPGVCEPECGDHAECTDGGCVCTEGYEGEADACTDIDECAEGVDNDCDPNAVCANTDGSYECTCGSGYDGDGFTCSPIDECEAAESPCGSGSCVDGDDFGYACECESGYTSDGGDFPTCVDEDECLENPCGVGTCSNSKGEYACECPWPWSFSGGTCMHCPPETALTMVQADDAICGLTAEDHAELLALVVDNIENVATEAVLTANYFETTNLYQQLQDEAELGICGDDAEPDCTDGLGVDDFAEKLGDSLREAGDEIFIADHIEDSDECAVTLQLPEDVLCPEPNLPESCVSDGCPTGYSCNRELDVCEQQSCLDAPCDGGVCNAETDLCEADCPWQGIAVQLVVWQPAESDAYVEVVIGEDDAASNPVDIRVFAEQVAIIADLPELLDTIEHVIDVNEVEDVELPDEVTGVLEVDLTMLGTDHYQLQVGVREDISASYTFEQAFDNYENEVPLPTAVTFGRTCPFVQVGIDADGEEAYIRTLFDYLEVVAPMAMLERFVFDGSEDTKESSTGSERDVEVEETCYSEAGETIPCPCADADGMPVDCESGDPVPCTFDMDGDTRSCLPLVGSAIATIEGTAFDFTVLPDDDDLTVRGLGIEVARFERDRGLETERELVGEGLIGPATEGGELIVTATQTFTGGDGFVIELLTAAQIVVHLGFANIVDREPDAPAWTFDETLKAQLSGDDPLLRLNLTDDPVTRFELLAGVFELFWSYDGEDDTFSGSLAAEPGQCLGEEKQDPRTEHPADELVVALCPLEYSLVTEVHIEATSPTTNMEGQATMPLGGEVNAYVMVAIDESALPTSFESATIGLYIESKDEGGFTVEAYRVLEAWDAATIVYDDEPSVEVLPFASIPDHDVRDHEFLTLDVSLLLEAWQANPSANHGIVLVAVPSGAPVELTLVASENERETRRPRVVIEPSDPTE